MKRGRRRARRRPHERRTWTRTHPRLERPHRSTGQKTLTSSTASVRPSLWTQRSTKQWPRPHQPQLHQSHTALATCPPSPQVQKILGPHSATATIATTIPSHHHMASRSPITPRDTLGPIPATATITFDLCSHRHPVSICHHSPHQFRSSRRFATRRGSPPQNPSSAPHPQFATKRHMRAPSPPADAPQHPLRHGPSTPCSPYSATVVLRYRFEDPPHLDNGSHACLGDVFDRGCDRDGRI